MPDNPPIDAEFRPATVTDRFADAKALAAKLERDVKGLTATVYGPSDRRCPFFKIPDPQDDDAESIDGVCDIRIQRFHPEPPFGPVDLNICQLCVRATAVSDNEDQFEAMAEAAEEARQSQEEGGTGPEDETQRGG